MRKLSILLFAFIILTGLTECHSKKKDLVGVWQLKNMVVNGTNITGNALGNWLWEFNNEGGYLTDVAAMREKGTYTLKDNMLTLKHDPAKNKPDQVYQVLRLDTSQLDLLSTDPKYNTSMHFIKRKLSDVAGDND